LAPAIANNANPCRYTRDIGVIALDDDKFSKNFKGNFVYLGLLLSSLSSSSSSNENAFF
jgi:hypothetical protein